MADDIVGEVSVRVRPDLTDFNSDLLNKLNVISRTSTGASSSINKALGSIGAGGAGAAGANQVNQALQNATASARQLGREVDDKVTSSFARASLTAAGFTAAIYASNRAIQGTIGKLGGLFDQLAQARAGFTSILKSETGAENLLAEIREFARLSPFVTQELVNYSQQLLGVGQSAQTIVPLLRSVGDIVASVGGDQQSIGRVLFTLTQIRTIGRLIGQDARQLQSALIPITSYLSEYLGKTTEEIKKMQEAGSISADTVFAALTAAGDKVEGAMDRATKNIKGAKAILTDTVTILFQNQPVMQRLFEDTYKGILKFADYLGTPAFQNSFNNFFESIERVYESVKPLVAEMTKIGGQGALVGLRSATTVFGAFADAIDAVPEPALRLIAQSLSAMALLKAPTMLLRYVASIRTITSGLLGGGVTAGFRGLNAGMATNAAVAGKAATANYAVAASLKTVGQQAILTAAQYDVLAAAARAQGYQPRPGAGRFKSALLTGGVVAAAVGGQWLQSQSSDNIYAQGGGGALTYGAMGAAVGGVPGAIIGAGVGAVIGFASASEEKARNHVAKMKELGAKAAEEFITSNSAVLKKATGKAAALLEDEMTNVRAQLADVQAKIAQAQLEMLRSGNTDGILRDLIPKVLADPEAQGQLEALQAQYTEMFGPIKEAISNTLKSGIGDDPALREQFFGEFFDFSGKDVLAVKSFEEVQSAAAAYGISLESLGADGGEALGRIFIAMNSVTDATKEALIAAGKFNGEYEKAKAVFEETFGARAKEIGTNLSAYEAEKKAVEAIGVAYKDQGNEILQLQAEQARMQAAAAIGAVAQAEAFKRTGDSAKAQIEGLAAAEAYLAGAHVQSMSTLAQLSATYGIAESKLIEILNLAKEFDPNIELVITANTADALAKLQYLLALQQKLLNPAGGTTYGSADTIERNQKSVADQIRAIFTDLQGVSAPTLEQANKGGGGGGGGPDPLKDAVTGLTEALNAAKTAADSMADALMSSIRERSEYERAVSVGALTRNASRQAADIAEIGTLTSSVLARGLSESALTSIIGDLGIEDLKQLRKLNAASGADLDALTAAVGNRDAAALKTAAERSRQEQKLVMVEAIVTAAGILGYKIDKKMAASIVANFDITSSTDATGVAQEILDMLSGALIST